MGDWYGVYLTINAIMRSYNRNFMHRKICIIYSQQTMYALERSSDSV